MLVLLYIGIFLLALLLYVLFAPFRLEIDTDAKLYRVSVLPFLRVRVATETSPAGIELRIFGLRRYIPFGGPARQEVAAAKEKKKKKEGRRPPLQKLLSRIPAILRSFRVKKFRLSVDTGDPAVNGGLYYWFYLFSIRTGHACSINFLGNNTLVLTIENNLFRILKAMITNK